MDELDLAGLFGGDDTPGVLSGMAPVEYTGPDLSTFDGNIYNNDPEAAYLSGDISGSNAGDATDYIKSQLSNAPKGVIDQLAAKLGITVKDPASTLSAIVGALGMLRNAGANGAQRQAAMTGINNLMGQAKPYSEANVIAGARKPTYRTADQFIVQPPASAGPLTLIKTGSR